MHPDIEGGDSSILCPRCQTIVVWPSQLSPAEKSSIAEIVRASVIEGARQLHGPLGLGLADAKGLAFHITRVSGQCHRCEAAVPSTVSICPNCRSANLDW